MRTSKLVLATLALLILPTLAWARAPKANVAGSAHDLRPTFGTPSYTLCSYCHVAHKTAAVNYPSNVGPLLWNHTLSSQGTYGVYTSDTFNSYGTDIADLGPLNAGVYTVSNLCLSCHDGTVAIDSAYNPVASTSNTVFMPKDTTIKDLTNTHPINFTYNSTLANAAHILVPADTKSVDGGGEIPLFSGKMQCVTCHDPHNSCGIKGICTQAFPTQTSGTFCTYCHT